jgi:flavin reductase (DIM6/NTAB) family NADH-FMN oxidoreductase RutF
MDNDVLHRALKRLETGVYVLTSRHHEHFGASTIAWAMQTSYKPVLFVAALARGGNVFRCLEQSRFAVLHVVGHRQFEVARRFACPTEAADGAINGEAFVDGATSAPVLKAFPAYVECQVEQIVESPGDHALVILRAVAARCRARFRPMTIAALRAYLDTAPVPSRRAPQPGQAPPRTILVARTCERPAAAD